MIKSNLNHPGASPLSTLAVVLGVFLAFVGAPLAAQASNTQQAQNPGLVTIPGGGTATLTVRGFCMDFGKPFPTQEMQTRALAPANIRAALNYAVQKGYTDSNAAQVQLAVWYLSDNQWRAEQRVIGQEIVTNATTANAPSAVSGGTSIVDAITQNQISVVSAKFVPQTADAFYGDGQVQVKNNGTAELRLYMPIGVMFDVPGSTQFQRLAAYALSTQQQPTSTAAVTQPATSVPSLTAVTTALATGTVIVSETATAVGTTTVEGTVTAGVSTSTVEATVTTEATQVATAVAVETATTAPTMVEATATAPAGAGTLPQTGSEDANWLPLAMLMMGIALMALGSGAKLLRRVR